MSWCPKCKNEYRAGITICPDCNEELLEELSEEIIVEYVPVFQTTDVELKERLVKYLIHCGHKIKEEAGLAENEEGEQTEAFVVLVPKEEASEALQEIHTVILYEAKQEAGDEDLKPRQRAPEPSALYVDAKARYQEYKSSGIMFLVFAVLFLVFGILNVTGILNLMASSISLVLIFVMAVAFAYIGVSSLTKVSSLKEEASAEENTTEVIMQYLKDNYPAEVLKDSTTHPLTGEELTGEELYFVRMEEMKEHLVSEFQDRDENYLDALLEEYYNSLDI